MKMKRLTQYFILLCISFIFVSCSNDDKMELLNNRVNSLINDIELHKVKNIKSYLTNNFSVAKRFNKSQFNFFLQHQLKSNKNISISILDKELVPNSQSVDITAKVLLLGSSHWIPEKGQVYKVDSRWVNDSGEWMLSKLKWEKIN